MTTLYATKFFDDYKRETFNLFHVEADNGSIVFDCSGYIHNDDTAIITDIELYLFSEIEGAIKIEDISDIKYVLEPFALSALNTALYNKYGYAIIDYKI